MKRKNDHGDASLSPQKSQEERTNNHQGRRRPSKKRKSLTSCRSQASLPLPSRSWTTKPSWKKSRANHRQNLVKNRSDPHFLHHWNGLHPGGKTLVLCQTLRVGNQFTHGDSQFSGTFWRVLLLTSSQSAYVKVSSWKALNSSMGLSMSHTVLTKSSWDDHSTCTNLTSMSAISCNGMRRETTSISVVHPLQWFNPVGWAKSN